MNLEKRVEELEKKVAVLEGQVQSQPQTFDENFGHIDKANLIIHGQLK